MNIHKWFSRFFLGSREIELLDHCPVETSAPDWRISKVIDASARFKKPFLCGPNGVPREVRITAKGNYMTVIKE